jgi:hypothetical protein
MSEAIALRLAVETFDILCHKDLMESVAQCPFLNIKCMKSNPILDEAPKAKHAAAIHEKSAQLTLAILFLLTDRMSKAVLDASQGKHLILGGAQIFHTILFMLVSVVPTNSAIWVEDVRYSQFAMNLHVMVSSMLSLRWLPKALPTDQ